MNIKWCRSEAKYSNGHILYLGKWKVCECFYNSSKNKDDKNKWTATCELPGIKKIIGDFDNEIKAKESAEMAVRYWIEKTGSVITLSALE